MAYEQKDNELVLFKNDKKESENHPDYKGSGMVNGVEVWLSAWVNKSSKGVTYMSLRTQNKEAVQKAGMAQAKEAIGNHAGEITFNDLDSIPFL